MSISVSTIGQGSLRLEYIEVERKTEKIEESGQKRVLLPLVRKKTLIEAHTGTLAGEDDL